MDAICDLCSSEQNTTNPFLRKKFDTTPNRAEWPACGAYLPKITFFPICGSLGWSAHSGRTMFAAAGNKTGLTGFRRCPIPTKATGKTFLGRRSEERRDGKKGGS